MLVSGMTSQEELCVAVEGGAASTDGAGISLTPCLDAIAAGDGRELWTFQDDGRLESVAGHKCMDFRGGSVVLNNCGDVSGSGIWELGGGAQLHLKSKGGDVCLSQSGAFYGDEDVALKSAVQATSTSDSEYHGAVKAVDGDEASYWSSERAPDSPQYITVDFGESRVLKAVEVEWELPAEDFSVEVSNDGASWTPVFSTDVNGLFTTKESLGFIPATHARLVLNKGHPIYGSLNGVPAFGIRRLSFIAPRLRTVVESCAVAEKSGDARDKYFLSYVGSFDPCPSKDLQASISGLAAERVSLAAAMSKLAHALPGLGSCGSFATIESSIADTESDLGSRRPAFLLRRQAEGHGDTSLNAGRGDADTANAETSAAISTTVRSILGGASTVELELAAARSALAGARS